MGQTCGVFFWSVMECEHPNLQMLSLFYEKSICRPSAAKPSEVVNTNRESFVHVAERLIHYTNKEAAAARTRHSTNGTGSAFPRSCSGTSRQKFPCTIAEPCGATLSIQPRLSGQSRQEPHHYSAP